MHNTARPGQLPVKMFHYLWDNQERIVHEQFWMRGISRGIYGDVHRELATVYRIAASAIQLPAAALDDYMAETEVLR